MKIKQSLSVSIRPMPVVFCAVSFVAAVVRMLQMLKFIDVETGFYKGGSILNILLLIILVGSGLYFAVVSFLSKETKAFDLENSKNTALGGVTAFFAFSLLCDWVGSFLNSGRYLLDIPSLSSVKTLMTSGTLPVGMQSIFALFYSCLQLRQLAGDSLRQNLKMLSSIIYLGGGIRQRAGGLAVDLTGTLPGGAFGLFGTAVSLQLLVTEDQSISELENVSALRRKAKPGQNRDE